MGDVIVKFMF